MHYITTIYPNTYNHSKEGINVERLELEIGYKLEADYRLCVVPCNPSQKREIFQCGRLAETERFHTFFQLNKKVFDRRNLRTEDKAQARAQVDNELLGRDIGARSGLTKTAERENSKSAEESLFRKDDK